ncbi:hypothetical protein [Piscibacillus halophilus]|uniref:hypothetical protein n=1 Tax=Piscibacillus halophilus TaxID=571933 RepID=UPI00158C72AA|nr:hypothetical protein [Piscibacillus halophilus]
MKKLFQSLLPVLMVPIFLVACGESDEGKELRNYHNDFMDYTQERMDEINIIAQEASTATSVEEMYEIQGEDLPVLAGEMLEYVESQEPETEVVQEYHELRKKQIEKWNEAITVELDALEQLVNGEISEDEATEISMEAQVLFGEFEQLTQEADEKLQELAEEYNIELEES